MRKYWLGPASYLPRILALVLLPFTPAASAGSSDSARGLKLLGECSHPARFMAPDDRLGVCLKAIAAGLSAELQAEARVAMGDIWLQTPTCPICTQPAVWNKQNSDWMSANCWRDALKASPTYKPARRRLFPRLLVKKKTLFDSTLPAALTFAQETVQLLPTWSEGYAQRAAALAALGEERWAEAIESYRRALELETDRDLLTRWYRHLGTLLGATRAWADAEAMYEEALARGLTGPEFRAELGFYYYASGRAKEARDQLLAVREQEPEFFRDLSKDDPVRQAYDAVVVGKPARPSALPSPVPAVEPLATGTAFCVSPGGYLVTNAHVVEYARRVDVRAPSGQELPARIVSVDRANDLALLKTAAPCVAIPIAPSGDAKLGSTVLTVGFPNPDLQGLQPKLTRGEINSLSGLQDDVRYFQVSAQVQPGNSGGALVDLRGAAVGVVSSRLSDRVALERSGSVPQNVNYAIKSSYLLSLLEAVPDLQPPPVPTSRRSVEAVAADLQRSTFLVVVTVGE